MCYVKKMLELKNAHQMDDNMMNMDDDDLDEGMDEEEETESLEEMAEEEASEEGEENL